jgi:hypothetical protein
VIITSLTVMLQDAISDPAVKRLEGNIKNFERLMQPEALARFEEQRPGPYAFLAFHPAGDNAVMSYIREDTLGDDSGPNVLCLFTLQIDARQQTSIQGDEWDEIIELHGASNPSGRMLRLLFTPDTPPPMPGVALFRSFLHEEPVVYASLVDCVDATTVRRRLRNIFNIAETAGKQADPNKPNSFADRMADEFQRQRLSYQRTGAKSMKEWLIKAYQVAWDLRSDILTVAGFLL